MLNSNHSLTVCISGKTNNKKFQDNRRSRMDWRSKYLFLYIILLNYIWIQ